MRVLLFTLALLLSGCATLVHGPSQSIRVESEPSGAHVEVDGRPAGKTPTTVNLKRDQEHRVRLYYAGEAAHTVTLQRSRNLWGSVSLFSMVIPGLVDLSTGAFYTLEPAQISPSLETSRPSRPNAP